MKSSLIQFLFIGSVSGFQSFLLPSNGVEPRNLSSELFAKSARNTSGEDCDYSSRSDSASSRRSMISRVAQGLTASTAFAVMAKNEKAAEAAPPIAIIAEELGYFPVTNRAGETAYVPARVRRKSSDQAIALAQHLKSIGAVMYGAYWCPHCSHQKELFGAEAWSLIPYVECSTKGFYYDAGKVNKVITKIDGFPTWNIPSNKEQWVSGEMPLERFVALSGYKESFDVKIEGPEVGITAGSCQ
mmetsp:Transcript_558/g.899  ORF Transcript_558/g.899 Transcript_558/m.899 type:complete len:243 (-) Transcript_558:105-833(-)